MPRMKKTIAVATAFLFAAVLSTPPQGFCKGTITIKGSDTLVILNQRWAENYMQDNKDLVIQVTGGGSGTGFSALITGSTDICAASRPIMKKELAMIKKRHNVTPAEIPVARDGVTIYFHEKNPVNELTMAQLKNIYTGKIKNWKDLGGDKARIILYSRENNSGTYMFFKDEVLKGRDFTPLAQSLPGTAAVVNAIGKDIKGIGYGGAAYAKGVKFCPVKATEEDKAYLPNEENIATGKYPIARDLYYYMLKEPTGDTKKFIDWLLSPEGQKIVTSVGYFPVKK